MFIVSIDFSIRITVKIGKKGDINRFERFQMVGEVRGLGKDRRQWTCPGALKACHLPANLQSSRMMGLLEISV